MRAASVEACSRGQAESPAKAILSLSLVVFACIFAILLISTGDKGLLRDPDTMWHIGVGRRILETGTFPWTDELSHTFAGQRWIAKEWLSQVILALAFAAGGWPAVVVVAAAAIALTFSLMFAELARQMRPAVALSMMLLAYALCSLHFLARPHVLSYPIAILWLAGLVRAVDRRQLPNLLLLPLMTLWANLHGGFTLGLGIAGLLALEAVFESDPVNRWKTLLHWALFLSGATVAACITPYGVLSIFATAQVFGGNEALSYIDEWRPMNFAREVFGGPMIVGLIFFALLAGVKIKFVRLVIITIVFYMMLVHIRLASIFALVTPFMIASSLRAQFPNLSIDSKNKQPQLLNRILQGSKPRFVAILFVILVVPSLWAFYARGIAPPSSIAPVAAVDHIVRTDPSGRVYNDFSFNGYLIFRGVKTFIDGRTDQLFGGGFLRRFFESPDQQADEFLKLLMEYKVTTAIVRPGSTQAMKLDNAPSWQRSYSDDVAAVYQLSKS